MTPRILLLPLLWSLCLALDVDDSPRKANPVSTIVDQLLEKLSREESRLGDVDFGEEVGRLIDLRLKVVDGLDKKVDGDGGFGIKLETTMRKVVLEGRYDIKYLDLPGLFPIFGKGDLSLEVDTIYLKLNLKALKDFNEDKFIVTLPVFDVSLQNTTVNLENLMDDPSLADFLNELLGALLPDLIRMIQKLAVDALTPLIEFFYNGVIRCVQKELLTGKLEECIRNITRTDSVVRLPVKAFLPTSD